MRHFLCGMATGCDLFFAEAVLKLREKLPDVTLEAAIPWEGQADGWPQAQRVRYDRVRASCDYETVVSKGYTPDCLMRRNQYMVDCSALLIAAYSGAAGGTRNTILYAMRRNVEIYEIGIDA